MRLINVDTLKMEEVIQESDELYLILSHTWTAEEISFQDYMWLQNHDEEVAEGVIDELPPKQKARVLAKGAALRQRAGYKKVFDFIGRAREFLEKHPSPVSPPLEDVGQEGKRPVYVWVDTCCINKESSAELSEAINSMYRWYKRAHLCVALLSDVTELEADPKREFGKSRWFTRGWTLQELIAPVDVVFYNVQGDFLGRRHYLASVIEEITAIGAEYLLDFGEKRRLSQATVAERMSWAAARETTRWEDEAYCLMGIFNVNMPLLYGEGGKAFVRLQQEIIKASEDQTIFAWGYGRSIWYHSPLAVFASSPSDFSFCGGLRGLGPHAPVTRDLATQDTPTSFEMTNIGLRITLTLLKLATHRDQVYAILPSYFSDDIAISVPVIWRQDKQARIENMRDGAVIERGGQDQPVAVPLRGLPRSRDFCTVVTRSVILRSVRGRRHPPPWEDCETFTVLIKHDDWSSILEVWCPSLSFDQGSGGREVYHLRFRGWSEDHRNTPWPIFIRACGVSSHKTCARTTTERLIVISVSLDPLRVLWIKQFDWDSIRRFFTPPAPSLLGMYMLSELPGQSSMRKAPWPEASGAYPLKFVAEKIRLRETPDSVSDIMSPEFSFRLSHPAGKGETLVDIASRKNRGHFSI